MKIDKELLKGNTSLLILRLLAKEDMYGYQITKELELASDNAFSLKEGTLYPILHSLEKEGLVTGYLEETESARKRRYYHITEKGRESFAQKKSQWDFFSQKMNQVMGGLSCEPNNG